jgi:hypothetical protein
MFRTPIDDKVSFFVCCGGKQGNREPKNLNAAMGAAVGGGPLPGGAAALPLPTSPLPNNQAQALSATYPPGKLVCEVLRFRIRMDPHNFLPDSAALWKLLIPAPTEYPRSVDNENPPVIYLYLHN